MKKLFSLISVLAVAGLGVGLLAACSEKEEEHVHSYTSSVTTAATCTEDGVMTYTCSCGDSYTEVIKASGHVVGEWVITVEPTCTEKGTQVKSCTVCGEVFESESIEALGHTWGAAVFSYDEETESITWTRTCVVCGEKEDLAHEDLADLEEAPVLEASSEDALVAGLTVDGATVVLAPELGEDAEEGDVPTIEVSESLKIAPAEGEESISVTIVVGDNSTLATSSDSLESTDENKSVPGLIDVQSGASLTLELGEGSSITGASGDAYTGNNYHDGLISVGDGGSIVINADDSANIIQTNARGAVINVDEGGSCEINGGHFEVVDCASYSVVNDGTMVINSGTFMTSNSGSSLIINGDDHDDAGFEAHTHSLTINGGEFYGGKHVVKNALHGHLEINDGVFDGFLGEYDGSMVNPSDDLIDNEDATAVINGGVFGAGNAEMLEEGETGNYKVTITVKGGHGENSGSDEADTGSNTSTVTINGGTFYKGSESLFAFGDSRAVKGEPASALDQLHILPEVFEAIYSDLDSTSYDIASEVNEAGYYVIAGASADSGDTGNDEP